VPKNFGVHVAFSRLINHCKTDDWFSFKVHSTVNSIPLKHWSEKYIEIIKEILMAHESVQRHSRELNFPTYQDSEMRALLVTGQQPRDQHHHSSSSRNSYIQRGQHHQDFQQHHQQQYRRPYQQENQQTIVLPPYSTSPSGTSIYSTTSSMQQTHGSFDRNYSFLRRRRGEQTSTQRQEQEPQQELPPQDTAPFLYYYDIHPPRRIYPVSAGSQSSSLRSTTSSFHRGVGDGRRGGQQQHEEEEELGRHQQEDRNVDHQEQKYGTEEYVQEDQDNDDDEGSQRHRYFRIKEGTSSGIPEQDYDHYRGNRNLVERRGDMSIHTGAGTASISRYPPIPSPHFFYSSSPQSSIPPSAAIAVASSHPRFSPNSRRTDVEYLYENRIPDRLHLPPPRGPLYVTRSRAAYHYPRADEKHYSPRFSGESSPPLPPPPFTLEKPHSGGLHHGQRLRPRFLVPVAPQQSQPFSQQPNFMKKRNNFKIEDESSIKKSKSFDSSTGEDDNGGSGSHKSFLQQQEYGGVSALSTEEEKSHGTSSSHKKGAAPKKKFVASTKQKDETHNMLDLLASVATMADSSKGNNTVKNSSCTHFQKSSSHNIGRIISEDVEIDDKESTGIAGNDRIKTPSPPDDDTAEEQPLKTVTPSYSSKAISHDQGCCTQKKRECDIQEEQPNELTESSRSYVDRCTEGISTENSNTHNRETLHNILSKNSSSLEDREEKQNEIPRHPLSSSWDSREKQADNGRGQTQQHRRHFHHQNEMNIGDEVVFLPHDLPGKGAVPFRTSYFHPNDHIYQYRPMAAHSLSPKLWNAPRDFCRPPRIQPRYELEEMAYRRFPLGNSHPFHPYDMRPNNHIDPSYPQLYEQTHYPTFYHHEQAADSSQLYTSQTGKEHLSLSKSISCNDGSKVILRRKCAWKNYPELEQFLIDNRDEYLRHSAMNYTQEQKQYNNELTERLLEVARKHNYEFDPKDFNFVSIRDRIRCYYKSYVQNCKKRGVSVSFKTANKKCKILEQKDPQMDNECIRQETVDGNKRNNLEEVGSNDDNGDAVPCPESKAKIESCHEEEDESTVGTETDQFVTKQQQEKTPIDTGHKKKNMSCQSHESLNSM
jgi:hypothetical protein